MNGIRASARALFHDGWSSQNTSCGVSVGTIWSRIDDIGALRYRNCHCAASQLVVVQQSWLTSVPKPYASWPFERPAMLGSPVITSVWVSQMYTGSALRGAERSVPVG